MSTNNHGLSQQQTELVALGASVGAGCQPCVDYHLKAARTAELAADRVRAAITTGQLVAAQAAQELARHLLGRLDPQDGTPAATAPLDTELSALGAAIGANDRTNIERHMTAATALGASPSQIKEAIAVAHTVQSNAATIHLRAAQRMLEELPPAQTPATAALPDSEGSCGCEATG